MKIYITAQQIRSFVQFGWIELEEFFTPKQCSDLLQLASQALRKRKGSFQESAETLYLKGRDLWREEDELKKVASSAQLTHTASALLNRQQLRLAFDQWIPPQYSYDSLRLETNFSFQNLTCGCLLSFEGEKAGCARFCQPDRFPLFETGQLLIAYGTHQTVYIRNTNDPLNGFLKKQGLSFGDRLDS